MQWKEIERTIGENRKYTEMLDYYDRTGRMPAKKAMRSFTLQQSNIDRLKSESAKKGKTMSALLDELIETNLR